MAGEIDQREQRQAGLAQALRTLQLGQVDDGRAFDHRGAQALQQAQARQHRAAGGDQVVDQHDAVAALHGIGVHLHGGAAVLELVALFHRGVGQLALLADRHEAHVELVGHHRADDEAARIQPGDRIGLHVEVAVHELVDQHPEHLGVLQQRRDVAELHARRRPVGHGADVVADVLGVQGGFGVHGLEAACGGGWRRVTGQRGARIVRRAGGPGAV